MDAMRFDALARSLAGFPVRRTRIDRIGGSAQPADWVSRAKSGIVCPTDRVACDGACVNPWLFEHDAKNCGACGAACSAGSFCVTGECV